MVLEIFVALLLGVFAGTFTGLFPGIHINLVAAGLLALVSSGYFAGIDVVVLAVFVVAMAVTHTFIDFIPSVYLGAPEEDSFLAVLPGHKLLKEGKGHEAVVLTLYGSLAALPVIIIFSLVFVYFLEGFFDFIRDFIPYVLLFASFYLIFREKEFLIAGMVFLLSGTLGFFSFNLPVREPLLPLLSGLFGMSSLIVSFRGGFKIPGQETNRLKDVLIDKKKLFKAFLAASVVAPLSSFLPGMGAGHAAVLGSEIIGEDEKDDKSFLFLVGAISTIVMALSFVTLYVIERARTGAAAAVGEILEKVSLSNLILLEAAILISGIFAFFVGVWLSKIFARNITKISYSKISVFVVLILFIVNLVISNFLGIVVLITGSALGVFAILSNVRRINLMGCLLVPTIVFYLV
ncbi:tripartite tricarboxylate transporter permease [Candidatus Pacearchaeota archaeon]|nr:tripartite tricarboxylate transporter permease [Candidatus Pacearchaeota archaeon]